LRKVIAVQRQEGPRSGLRPERQALERELQFVTGRLQENIKQRNALIVELRERHGLSVSELASLAAMSPAGVEALLGEEGLCDPGA
jgi:hypothetical protein